jgi:hypothetical protein
MPAAGQIIKALDFTDTVSTQSSTAETGFTSTSYTGGTSPVGIAFTAPTSGRVEVFWHCRFESNTAGVLVLVSAAVRTGTTVGSGTVVVAAADAQALVHAADASSGTNQRLGSGTALVISGLTAGSSYNARIEFKMNAAGNGDIFDRYLSVKGLA